MRASPAPCRFARLLAAVGAIVATAALGACGASAPSQGELTEAFETSGLSEEVAACASASLTDNLSDDELVLLMERGGGGTPLDDPDDDADTADLVREALAACRALEPSTTTVPIGGAAGGGAEPTPSEVSQP